jgi:alkylation response protein AidB-like acyl-CoA dehydrogenase
VSVVELDSFREQARAWLVANRRYAPPDYGAIVPPALVGDAIAWQRRIRDAGFAGIHWPAEFGGQGLSTEHNGVWIEQCALEAVPPFINMVGIVLAGAAILRFGTPEQQGAHLRATLRADEVWCQLFSEPGAGSDLASLSTRAEADDDGFVVNGQKVWTSGGRYSQWGILMARTGGPDRGRHDGISFFLLDMRSPGVEIRPLRQMTGEAEFDEVFFTDVRMPAHSLLGPLHGGWGVGMAVLTNERGHIGAAAIGMRRRLDAIAAMATGRELRPVDRDHLAGLLASGHAYRALTERQGPMASTSGSLLKLGITEMLFEMSMTRAALAGAGAMLEGPAATGVLAAPGGRIAGGTSQVQRNIIGERLLGLPREPKG